MTYTTREAAARIGVHELTLRQWELEGKIPKAPRNLQGNRIYTEKDILNLLAYKNTGRYEISPVTTANHFEIIAFVNQKGGVAKTTTSVNLAAAFARLGKRVLLVDLDPQGHAGLGLGIDIHADIPTMYDVLIEGKNITEIIVPTYAEGLYIAPSNIELSTADLVTSGMLHRNILLKKALRQLPDDFELVLIDCPPTIGILTYNALIACTRIFVPVEMDFYALEGMSQLIDTINLVNEVRDEPIDISRVIITKYERHTKITQAALSNIKDYFGDKVCRTFIRKNTTIREAPSEGKSILDYAPHSSGALDYWKLAQEIFGAEQIGAQKAKTPAPEEKPDSKEETEAVSEPAECPESEGEVETLTGGTRTDTDEHGRTPVPTEMESLETAEHAKYAETSVPTEMETLPQPSAQDLELKAELVETPTGTGVESKEATHEAK